MRNGPSNTCPAEPSANFTSSASRAANMLFLYIVGDNVEDRVGHVGYLVFYTLAGVAAAAAHVYYTLTFARGSAGIPTVGASGAISGMMGAYLVFFPSGKIKFILWLVIFIRDFTLPAWGAIGFWILGQFVMARPDPAQGLQERARQAKCGPASQ